MSAYAKAAEGRARYAVLKAAGLCVGCKGTPLPGRTRCRACFDVIKTLRTEASRSQKRRVERLRKRAAYHVRLESGCCTQCGKPARGYRQQCDRCAGVVQARRHARRRAAGIPAKRCGFCRTPGHDVRSCLEARKAARAAQIAEAAGARVST